MGWAAAGREQEGLLGTRKGVSISIIYCSSHAQCTGGKTWAFRASAASAAAASSSSYASLYILMISLRRLSAAAWMGIPGGGRRDCQKRAKCSGAYGAVGKLGSGRGGSPRGPCVRVVGCEAGGSNRGSRSGMKGGSECQKVEGLGSLGSSMTSSRKFCAVPLRR